MKSGRGATKIHKFRTYLKKHKKPVSKAETGFLFNSEKISETF